MGKLRPYRDSPNNESLLFYLGGDSETIEQYVLENVQIRNPCAKVVNFYEINARNGRKNTF